MRRSLRSALTSGDPEFERGLVFCDEAHEHVESPLDGPATSAGPTFDRERLTASASADPKMDPAQKLRQRPVGPSLSFAMKWFIAALVLGLATFFFVSQRNATKVAYVNGLPEYNRLPNQEFIFERDCYIFKFKERNSTWPLVAARDTVPALPAEVSEKNVGADLPDVRILDVVHAGARFKLVSVRRDENRAGTTITFEILFIDEAERKYPRLDAFYLLDHTPEKNGAPPVFIERYAVPRVVK
jgi:hypothetical protein